MGLGVESSSMKGIGDRQDVHVVVGQLPTRSAHAQGRKEICDTPIVKSPRHHSLERVPSERVPDVRVMVSRTRQEVAPGLGRIVVNGPWRETPLHVATEAPGRVAGDIGTPHGRGATTRCPIVVFGTDRIRLPVVGMGGGHE